MQLRIITTPCATGITLPLVPASQDKYGSLIHQLHEPLVLDPDPYSLPVGSRLYPACNQDKAIFMVSGRCYLPQPVGTNNKSQQILLLARLAQDETAESNLPIDFFCKKQGLSVAVVTLSDKGFQGNRADLAGPEILNMLGSELAINYAQEFLLPDEKIPLRALLTDLALLQGYDLICTTGGTGLSTRDITPQVSKGLLDMELPGFAQAMLGASLLETPNAAISRLVCGVIGKTILLNLPGSVRAVRGNLSATITALPHALAKLHGENSDCGG